MSTDTDTLHAPPLPAALPPVSATGPVVVATGRRDQRRSRWIPTLSTAWCHPEAVDRPVVAMAPQHNLNVRDGMQELLFALGKDPHVTGAGFKDDGNLDVPAAWLIARHTRELVVRDANVVSAALQRTLVELAVGVGARIWLIAHEHRENELDELAELWCAHRTDLDTFDTWWARPEARPPRARRAVPRPVRCDLPAAAALTFRAECRRLLPPERFAEVDELYTSELLAARSEFQGRIDAGATMPHEVVLARVRARVREQRDAWQVLVCARAVEAAAVPFGFDVDIDHHQLINAAERNPRRGRLARTDHAALDAYSRTSWPAASALAACELALDDICDVTVGDIADDGATVADKGTTVEVPGSLRPYLVAHKLVRVLTGASDDEPAFVTRNGTPASSTWITRTVKVTEVECGVRLSKSRADRRRITTNDWGLAHGISVRTIFDGATRRRQRT
jgi:hypothetical protein